MRIYSHKDVVKFKHTYTHTNTQLELSVLMRLDSHKNVVKFLGTATNFNRDLQNSRPFMGLVFELCDLGNLQDAVMGTRNLRLKVNQKINICSQVACGMSYLHSRRIIHRDMNTRNVLLTANLTAKIADFGCARIVPESGTLKTTTLSGSPAYMSPEQLQGSGLTVVSDVWALGVIMWELMTGKKPWDDRYSEFQGLKFAIMRGEKLRIPHPCPPYPQAYIDLIFACMQIDPASRGTAQRVHAQLKDIESKYRPTN
jgi:serine/threonine protein kinase